MPVTSTKVATNGLDAMPGSTPMRRKTSGSIEPTSVPHRQIADTDSAKAFSMAMMGTEAPDDALYEMLNIVGGRIKQAVTASGRDATLDVPSVEKFDDAPVPTLSPACLVLAFGVQGQSFALTVICDADPPARGAMKAAS